MLMVKEEDGWDGFGTHSAFILPFEQILEHVDKKVAYLERETRRRH